MCTQIILLTIGQSDMAPFCLHASKIMLFLNPYEANMHFFGTSTNSAGQYQGLHCLLTELCVLPGRVRRHIVFHLASVRLSVRHKILTAKNRYCNND